MKKGFLFTLVSLVVLSALFTACNRIEKDLTVTDETILAEEGEGTEVDGTQTIIAYIADDEESSKTAYDSDGKFSWNKDRITVVVYNDGTVNSSAKGTINRYTYSTSSTGKTASFTGSNISSPWVETGVALYPNYNSSSYNCLTEGGSYDVDNGIESLQVTLNQEIRPNLSTPLDLVPLIGRKDGEGNYRFKTATGILKITIENIPSAARYVVLQSNDDYAMSGTFNLDEGDTEIKESNFVSGYYKKSIYFEPESDGETRSFFFPLPTGTIPAGMTLSMDTASSERILTKTTRSSITITANHITPIKAVTAEHYKTIGTAKFYDKGPGGEWDAYYHADVELQQSLDNTNQYRLVDPYGVYKTANSVSNSSSSDAYLTFTIDPGTNLVTFEEHATGLELNSHAIVIRHPSVSGNWSGAISGTTAYNKVRLADGSGNPLVVQLAPYYCYSDMSNGWSRQNYDHKIEILFPGYAPEDVDIASSSLASDTDITVTVSGTNVATAKLSCNRWASFSGMSASFDASTGTTVSGFSGTGIYTRQFAIMAYNSDGTEIYHNYIEKVVYSLSDDATTYAKRYDAVGTYSGSSLSTTITLAVSDDVFAGNLMITEFDGMCYDVSESTQWDSEAPNSHYFKDRDQASFTDGKPIYGYYTAATTTGINLTFSNVQNQPLFYDNNGAGHTLRSSGTDLNMCLGYSNSYQDGHYKLICWNANMDDAYILGDNLYSQYTISYLRGDKLD